MKSSPSSKENQHNRFATPSPTGRIAGTPCPAWRGSLLQGSRHGVRDMENTRNVRLRDFAEIWSLALSISDTDERFIDVARKIGTAWSQLGFPESDDPIDDFINLIRLHPSVSTETMDSECPPRNSDSLIVHLSKWAATLAPGWSKDQWLVIISVCFSARYSGTRVRIKKNPALLKHESAKKMTPKQLMEEYGISRSYAYKLLSKTTSKK